MEFSTWGGGGGGEAEGEQRAASGGTRAAEPSPRAGRGGRGSAGPREGEPRLGSSQRGPQQIIKEEVVLPPPTHTPPLYPSAPRFLFSVLLTQDVYSTTAQQQFTGEGEKLGVF